MNRFYAPVLSVLLFVSCVFADSAPETSVSTNEQVAIALKAAGSTNSPEAVAAMTVLETSPTVESNEVAVAQKKVEEEQKKPAGFSTLFKKKTPEELWAAFEPPPDTKYDWLQFDSGEWIKGELKTLYSQEVEFDSDELDLLIIDFEDVKRIRTCEMKTILFESEEGRHKPVILRGMLDIQGQQIILRRGEHEVVVPRDRLISVATGREKERDKWSGEISLGFNLRGGNTRTTDANIMAELKRRTVASRFNLNYLANYSYSSDEETVNNQRLDSFYDRFLTTRLFWKILAGEYYRDPFSNIEGQYTLASGAGVDLIRSPRTEWSFSIGAGYLEQRFSSVEAGESDNSHSPFFVFETTYDTDLTKRIDYLFDYTARLLNEENGSYSHHLLTKISIDLIKDFDLDLSFIWDRIENPKPDSSGDIPEKDDYQVVFGLSYDF